MGLGIMEKQGEYIAGDKYRLWCANIRSRGSWREMVLVMQSAKDRLGADGVRVVVAVTRTGLSEVENCWWRIRNAWAQRHVWTPGIVVRDPGFQNGS